MLLAARCYAFTALVCALAIMGQWSSAIDDELWRMPAAALLLALLIEGVVNYRQGLHIERRLPARGFLGQPLSSELVVHNGAPYTCRLDTLDDTPTMAHHTPADWTPWTTRRRR